jgi:predicted transcriptional regulator
MADDALTDQEIAILCDVVEGSHANWSAEKRKVLDELMAKGFVVSPDQNSSATYELTAKARQLLAERGVGLSGG